LRRRLESVTWARSSSQFNAMSATVPRYRIPDDSTALSTPYPQAPGRGRSVSPASAEQAAAHSRRHAVGQAARDVARTRVRQPAFDDAPRRVIRRRFRTLSTSGRVRNRRSGAPTGRSDGDVARCRERDLQVPGGRGRLVVKQPSVDAVIEIAENRSTSSSGTFGHRATERAYDARRLAAWRSAAMS
jgi:hypothetical protein